MLDEKTTKTPRRKLTAAAAAAAGTVIPLLKSSRDVHAASLVPAIAAHCRVLNAIDFSDVETLTDAHVAG